MSDDQGLRLKLEIVIPQETLEEVAKAIPVVDMVPALVEELHGNEEALRGLLTALVRELGEPRSHLLGRELSQAVSDAYEV